MYSSFAFITTDLYQLLSFGLNRRPKDTNSNKSFSTKIAHLHRSSQQSCKLRIPFAKVFRQQFRMVLLLFSVVISTFWLLIKFSCGSTCKVSVHTQNINYLRHTPFIINYIPLWHLRFIAKISCIHLMRHCLEGSNTLCQCKFLSFYRFDFHSKPHSHCEKHLTESTKRKCLHLHLARHHRLSVSFVNDTWYMFAHHVNLNVQL